MALAREEQTSWLSSTKWSALEIDIQVSNAIWTQQVILGNIYVCINIYYVIIIDIRRDHEFEGEQGKV